MTEAERQAEQARKNQRAHRAAEAAALLLLTRARNKATSLDASKQDIARAMQPSMRDAIVIARNGARARGLKRLVDEADSLGVDVALPGRNAAFMLDWARAERAARSYADRWLKKATSLDSPTLATRETAGSLERIAVTESSQAFSVARAEALEASQLYEQTKPEKPRIVQETTLMRSWDATLDKNTCPTCESMDGTLVGLRESFRVGEPGSVHPLCRCGFTIVRVTFKG